jgi:transcriptional regulator with XRE-family HTH domain
MPVPTLIGTMLRERRLAGGVRQSVVAERAGMSSSYLNLIEHNRRNVTPAVLDRLAAALGIDAKDLTEGAGSDLIDELRVAAAGMPDARAELDRLQEFVGRYPGWAGLTAGLQARVGALERAVEAMNDRMTHDPHLSAALHELLSALTGVRATSQILAEVGDLDGKLVSRFHQNLHNDSERLALGAEALVSFLEGSEAAREQGIAAPQEEVEAWLRGNDWHFPALETDGPAALEPQIAGLATHAARTLAREQVARMHADAVAVPLAALTAALGDALPDPAALATRFGTDVIRVMRRLALLPGYQAGFVSCDASGTLTLRKPLPGFPLPRFGAACPLWPLFSALVRPYTPVRTLVQTAGPSGERFLAFAFCQTALPQGFTGAELREAAMLILPARGATGAGVPVGSTCRICPRNDCPARREPSIMKEGI